MTVPGCYWVVGTPAAGKSTLARRLAVMLDLRYVELDDPFWDPDWTPADADVFLGAVGELLDEPGWVADGQYPTALAAHAARAHAIIWVDPPLWVSLPRLIRRTVARAWRRSSLWTAGNVETWWHAIGPQSVIWYAIAVHREQRRSNEELFRHVSPLGVELIHVRRPNVAALADHLRVSALRKDSTVE